ncbi:MAG: VIT and VWA domain-containing protein [Planctomycetes bacterium]|nr:VIT and VWA domain-containing protein [Planctomycetota bacterium]
MFCAASVSAQGIAFDRRIRPRPEPRPVPSAQQIEIRAHAVETVVDGQSATTTVTQTFYNPNSWQLEGTYMFPLPPEAAISDFQMTMNDKMVKGELLGADKAKQIYTDTVRRMIDPGLLEYAGRGLFQASVFPILPQKDLTIKFTYTELLPYDSGLVSFRYPLRTEGFCPLPVSSISVKVTLKGEQALRTIYSPTHSVEIIRKGENEAVIGLELKDNQPSNDFELFYGHADGAVAANVMSFREGEDAGYFLALLTPKVKLTDNEILPKDVIVVLDTSGSMDEDGKIDQARKAMTFMVNKLNEKDRFALVTFSTEARKLHDKLTPASKEAKQDAVAKIEKLEATGGTNLEQAISFAYELAATGAEEGRAARPCYVILLSDGIPTMGEITDVKALAKLAREKRTEHVRMFPFGVGNDVNTWLLDTLAEEGKGQREYLKPKEDMEVKVSNFANKIASPVLSDVTLKIDGAELHDLHPQIPGDVFAGTQLSVLGRFDKPGKHQLLLEGTVNGEKRAYEYSVNLTEKDAAKGYLPRMWGVRRVGYLMDQINLKGYSEELKNEIVRLGTKFGIVTPYTSFLIVEDETRPMPRPGAPMPDENRRGERAAGEGGGDGITGGVRTKLPSEQKGGKAVEDSKNNADRRDAQTGSEAEEAEKDAADDLAARAKDKGFGSRSDRRLRKLKEEGWSGEQAEKLADAVIKTVGTRSFIWTDGLWLESDLTNGELFGAETVDYLSERYFELAEDASVARILALGQEVIFRHGKITIRIVADSDTAENEEKGDKDG